MIRKFVQRAMSSTASTRRQLIAVCQLTSQHDLDQNWQVCAEMVAKAKARNSKMVFFPECFDYVGRSKEESISLAMDASSDYIGRFRDLAKQHGVWLSLGGFHNKISGSQLLPFNTHLIIDDHGETKASYNKLHLFDLNIPGRVCLLESEFSSAGKELVPPVDTPIGRLGLSICYDLRFSELSLWNRYQGAEVLSFPSSFTVNTGLAHWEALIRCRAIETQCYVVAAGQTGKHNEKRSSYGHSMVVDPWGVVIAQCSETVGMCFAEIDLDYVAEVRQLQPILSHRRSDLYSLMFSTPTQVITSQKFDVHDISKETIFFQTDLSYAFVNLKPVLPGHVLCAPKRVAKKLTDLSNQEIADLFNLAKRVQGIIEAHYNTNSATVTVQDGVHAGQTVAHVHVHILPRKSEDFGGNSDKIYAKLEGHEEARKSRSIDELVAEASIYRELINL